MSRLIGLFGLARSGKDSLAKLLKEEENFSVYHWADKLRDVLYSTNPIVGLNNKGELERLRDVVDTLGWERAKLEYREIGRLLQSLGTEGCRDNISKTVWVDALMKKIEADRSDAVIADGRFSEEADAIRSRGGLVVMVERPFREETGRDPNHRSETELESIIPDYLVHNEAGLSYLREKAVDLNRFYETRGN